MEHSPTKEQRIVTVISMYRAHDAEMFVTVVEGSLSDEDKDGWRKSHSCDDHATTKDDDKVSNMGFREIDLNSADRTLWNAYSD